MKQVTIEQKKKLPEGWRWSCIEKVCRIKPQSGGTPLSSNPNYYDGDIPWVITEDMTNAGMYIFDTRKKITKDGLENSNAKYFPKGTILFAMYGSIGRMSITTRELTTNQAILGLIPDINQVLTEYLYYYLDYTKKHLIRSGRGGTQANVNAKMVCNFPIIIPPLSEQQKIVDKFNKQIAQIEIMKKEVYKENMAADIIFESLIKKEIMLDVKKLPKDWNIYKIEEICELKTGGTPSKSHSEFFGGNIKWMVSGDINKEFIYDVEGRITQEGYDNSNARILQINSVLMALNGQGKTRGTVAVLKSESTCNQSIIAFIPKNKDQIDYMYLFYYFKGCYQKLRNITGDNERSGLSIRVLKPFSVIVPPLKIQKRIVTKLEKARGEVKNIHENVNSQFISISILSQSILNEVFGKYEFPEEK